MFCPRFFKDGRARYINRITSGGSRPANEIGSLISYEYIVIHEWMHNKLFGYRFMSEFKNENTAHSAILYHARYFLIIP